MTPSSRPLHDPARSAALPPPAEPPSPGAASSRPLETLRVLVAEDHPANQRMIGFLLERLGCTCVMVGDGLSALEMLSRSPFDVVFIDMQMPVLDGLATVRRLRASAPSGPRPWIIALTGNASEDDREACYAAGMDDFLAKPITFPVFSEALQRALRQLGPAS